MPLISCPECTRTISSEAEACPHCGLPHPRRKTPEQMAFNQKMNWGCGIICGVIILLLIASGSICGLAGA